MTLRVSVIPSNQHLNPYTGLPGVTEEKFARAVCDWLVRRLRGRGADAAIFHVTGKGSASTDELMAMIAQASAWNPDYTVSVHSDAVGDAKQTGILMLMAREEDRSKGQRLGRAIAERVGLPYKATWVYGHEARKIAFLSRLRADGAEGSLVEVGEHATVAEAAWNWRHTKEIGVGIADALADYLELEDDMTDEDRKLLKQARLSDVARSYDMEIIKALVRGDEDVAARLEAEKGAAVETERKRLGL